MLTVAKVACSIREHWEGEGVDWDFVEKSALLHDIGNIVKFKFDLNSELMGEEAANIEYWRGVQKEIIGKYGADDHLASGNMLKEIGVKGELWNVIQNKSFGNVVEVSKGDDWYAKILLYADMRVMPFGVATLEERMEDVRARMPQYTSRPDFEDMLNATREIEQQIVSNLDLSVDKIKWGVVEKEDSKLLAVKI